MNFHYCVQAIYQKSHNIEQCYGISTDKYDLSRRFCSTQKLCLPPGVHCIEDCADETGSVVMDGRRINPSPVGWGLAVVFIENSLSVL